MSDRTRILRRLRPILARALCTSTAAMLVVLALPPVAAHAAKDAAMVIDANTGRVLYSSNGDEPRYPASLTKMMTLYLTFELIEMGRLKLSDRIRISAQAAAQPPSKLELDVGDTIAVRDAILSLVTKSANDIAVALAEHIGGSEANFARLMTRKARALGMAKTTFRNASGLPNSQQVTTARDMLTLAMHLQDEFPEHYRLFRTQRFSYASKSYRNHNTLLRSYRGTDGIKTGYTRASGFNLVSSVHRGGKHLIAAVFGGATAGKRNARMRAILDRSFIKASTRRTRPNFKRPMLVAKPKLIERPHRSVLAPTKPPPLPKAAPDVATAALPKLATAAPAAGNTITNRVTVARVRSVGVAHHFAKRRARARDIAATAPANAPTDAPPRSISELIASTHASSERSGLGVQVKGAITASPSEATPPGLAPAAPATADTAAAPGRPPSTLQSQLSNILATHHPSALDSGPEQPVRMALRPTLGADSRTKDARATAASAQPPPQGTHLIQIGAYNTADEAERQLRSIRQQAMPLLGSAAPVTESVTRGQRQFYRARFAGFDSSSATTACQELRRRSIDCFVTRMR